MQFCSTKTSAVLIPVLASWLLVAQCQLTSAQTPAAYPSDGARDGGTAVAGHNVDPACAASEAAAARRKRIEEAAGDGNPVAQYNLGVMYWCGSGVKSDFVEAATWYRKAAGQGYGRSQFSLAEMYLHGYGVPRDAVTAVYWLRKAADQGEVAALSELGNLYVLGIGVHEDATLGAALLRKAAIQGDESAQTKLGLMLKNGHGVKQNLIAAYAWLKIAETTHPGSVVGLLDYRPTLSGESLSTAEEIARNWRIGTMVPEDVQPTSP